jgi:hypothetical protein
MEVGRIIKYGFFILVYIFAINFIASILIMPDFSLGNYTQIITSISDGNQAIGMGDSVSVGIIRNRPYGTIYESTNGNSNIKLFNLIKLPLKSYGLNFGIVHLIFVALIIFLIYRGNKKINLNKKINKDTKQIKDIIKGNQQPVQEYNSQFNQQQKPDSQINDSSNGLNFQNY